MRLIPVLDLKAGLAVHAIAGQREKYQPVQSCLTPSSDPVKLAEAFMDRLGLEELYLADLDAIAGAGPSLEIYRQISDLGMRLMVDAGVRTADSLKPLLASPVASIVIGLETVANPRTLAAIVRRIGSGRAVFSLDMKNGRPLGAMAAWGPLGPLHIGRQAIVAGIRRMILLDLSKVGTGKGMGTKVLCRQLRRSDPQLELIVGGGVRAVEDLKAARDAGASAVLVATAFHTGQITRDDLSALGTNGSPGGHSEARRE